MRRAIVLAAALAVPLALLGAERGAAQARPNVVVIMTDDQTLESMRVMERTRALIGDRGVTFANHLVSYPLCCPSRASFLTGQYAHNHGVRSNHRPEGGYEALDGENTLPVWLRSAGYRTAFIGKYLNGYGRGDETEIPPGWDEWYGGVASSTYLMWGYTLNENGRLVTYGHPLVREARKYQTDVYGRKAAGLVRRLADPDEPPFFLWVSFLAPHNESSVEELPRYATPRPAPRHRGDFADLPLPDPPGFDEPRVGDKPAHVRDVKRIDRDRERRIAAHFRARMESLLAVDDAVDRIVDALRSEGVLRDTLVIFTSDNGYLHGEHRIPWGKFFPYEPSVRTPLLMRGPGIQRGAVSRELVMNVDIAPTILDVSGAEATVVQDGRSLMELARAPAMRTGRPILIEALEPSVDDDSDPRYPHDWSLTPRDSRLMVEAPAYRGIRTTGFLYVEYSTGELELYDLDADPFQLRSVHADPTYADVRAQLQLDLVRLASCAGWSCRGDPQEPTAPR